MLKLTFKDLDLRGADLRRADLSGANLICADLSRADLRGAYFSRACLRGAYLRGADLSHADLNGADLSGANLICADFSGAKIKNDTVSRLLAYAGRMDGHVFYAFELQDGGGAKIMAGGRWYTFPEFRAHIEVEYLDTDKAIEAGHILDFLQARVVALGVTP